MDPWTWLAAFKFLGIALTAGFGVLGIVTEFKDDDGRVTKWGRRALAGVLVSGIASAAAQALELSIRSGEEEKARQSIVRQLKTNSQILRQLDRSLNPLENVRASYWLTVPIEDLELRKFANRFERLLPGVLEKLRATPERSDSDREYTASADPLTAAVRRLAVQRGSALHPRASTEEMAHAVLAESWIKLSFFREPIAIHEFIEFGTVHPDKKQADLRMEFDAAEPDPAATEIQYDLESERFEIRGSSVRTNSENWSSNGKILSVLDLAGAQVFIRAGHSRSMDAHGRPSKIEIQPRELILRVGDRTALWLKEEDLEPHRDSSGFALYEYRFPKEIEGVEASPR